MSVLRQFLSDPQWQGIAAIIGLIGVIVAIIALVASNLPQPPATPTPYATNTNTAISNGNQSTSIPVLFYPCDGTIKVNTSPGVGLNQVHVIAQADSPNRPPAVQGSTVSIVETQSLGSNKWYQVQYKDTQGNTYTGWIESQYVTSSKNCPT